MTKNASFEVAKQLHPECVPRTTRDTASRVEAGTSCRGELDVAKSAGYMSSFANLYIEMIAEVA